MTYSVEHRFNSNAGRFEVRKQSVAMFDKNGKVVLQELGYTVHRIRSREIRYAGRMHVDEVWQDNRFHDTHLARGRLYSREEAIEIAAWLSLEQPA